MRLQEALAMLSAEEREALRALRRIVLDPRKKIDEIEQTARALIAETDLRHSRFPSEVRALLARLAGANGTLANAASDPGAAMLGELGIAYQARGGSPSGRGAGRTGKRLAAGALVLPSAFQIQVAAGPGDDPRSLRVCLGFVESEIVPTLVATVVGKPLAVTGPLALQEVWEVLSVPGEIAQRVAQLPAAEARLLDAIERAGSEVTTEELLGLDQTPGLYRTAAGIAVPKRGAPYMLQRRGFLFQIGVDRFALPTEVSRVVGASRAAERAGRRAEVLATLKSDDFAPRRARYARDPSLAAGATLALMRHWEVALRDDTGAPRGSIRRIAERLGEREETVALWVAVMRAAGLGRLLVTDAAVPGSLARITVSDLGALMRATYRRGGAWDETRVDAEVARTGFSERATTAAPALRMILLEALEELARERWVPVDVVVKYAMDDPRAAGAARIHERARRERPDVHRENIEGALRAMLTESIPAIGLVDLADDASTVRLSSREHATGPRPAAVTVVRNAIEIGASVSVASLVTLADIAEPDHIRPDAGVVVLTLGAGAAARARDRGYEARAVLGRFESVGLREPLPPAVAELVAGLAAARDIAAVPLGAALVVEDAALRAEILGDAIVRRAVVEMDSGALILLRADTDMQKLGHRLARMGVRLHSIEPPASGAENETLPSSQMLSAPVPEIRRRKSIAPPPPAGVPHVDGDEGDGSASIG